MNCPYCQEDLGVDSGAWMTCNKHQSVWVYVYSASHKTTKIQMNLRGINHNKCLSWDANGKFRMIDNELDGWSKRDLLTLDYHPDIKPEEAIEFWHRMMRIMVFS